MGIQDSNLAGTNDETLVAVIDPTDPSRRQKVRASQEATVYDGCDNGGLETTLALTTTAVEGKVGGSAKTDRKYVEFQAQDNNIKWGYTTTCVFDAFKSQFFSLPCGPNTTIYFKMSTGTGSISFAEK